MTSDADVAARIARQRALALEHAAATTCASLACAPPRAWDDARALIEASATAQRQRAETRARVDAWRAREAASAAKTAAETAVIEREARARRAREAREEARERAVREGTVREERRERETSGRGRGSARGGERGEPSGERDDDSDVSGARATLDERDAVSCTDRSEELTKPFRSRAGERRERNSGETRRHRGQRDARDRTRIETSRGDGQTRAARRALARTRGVVDRERGVPRARRRFGFRARRRARRSRRLRARATAGVGASREVSSESRARVARARPGRARARVLVPFASRRRLECISSSKCPSQ